MHIFINYKNTSILNAFKICYFYLLVSSCSLETLNIVWQCVTSFKLKQHGSSNLMVTPDKWMGD